jgi:hypothetical protein
MEKYSSNVEGLAKLSADLLTKLMHETIELKDRIAELESFVKEPEQRVQLFREAAHASATKNLELRAAVVPLLKNCFLHCFSISSWRFQ